MQPRMKDVSRTEDRPLGELFSDLANETSSLVRNEVSLAKIELTQKATEIGKNIGFLAIGGAVAYAAFLALGAAIIMLLAKAIPAWAAALIIGVLVAATAWLLIQSALSKLQRTELTPEQTVETLKEDAQWIKEQVK